MPKVEIDDSPAVEVKVVNQSWDPVNVKIND